jgi:hypothetical protein
MSLRSLFGNVFSEVGKWPNSQVASFDHGKVTSRVSARVFCFCVSRHFPQPRRRRDGMAITRELDVVGIGGASASRRSAGLTRHRPDGLTTVAVR